MKVIRLTAENVKRLKAVQIEPNGNVVVIAGRNGQGKSSVIDSIWFALGGAAAMKATPKPMREGTTEASVELDLGDFVVKRTWKDDKTSLSVMSKDGMKPQTPQKFLDEKLGALSFDPLAFSQQDDKTQLQTLLDLVELPYDPVQLAFKRGDLYSDRTDVGREIRILEGQLAGFPNMPEDVPDEEVSTSSIVAAMDAHAGAVREAEESHRAAELTENNVLVLTERLALMREELAAAERTLEVAIVYLEKAQGAVLVVPEDRDFAEELEGVETINSMVRTKREIDGVREKLADAKGRQKGLTDEIAAIDKEKAEALAGAKMPVEGMAFDDEGVTYNGVPFKQCSSAEQLRVSIAMAMTLNPEIRVIRISDGSLLDSANMAIIEEMAAEHDFQCWIERVDETGEIGFVIEDGEVVK